MISARKTISTASVQSWLEVTIRSRFSSNHGAVGPGVRFRELGLDSGQLLELVALAGRRYGCRIAATAPWEHPTPRALAAHIVATLATSEAEASRARTPAARAAREGVAIVGIGCRLPGGVAGPGDLWALLCAGGSGVTEVPAARWDARAWFDEDRFAPGKSTTRAGGFLADVAGFEPSFFGVTPTEAAQMDPQQRLILELAWEALEDARIRPRSLREQAVGVFIGAMWSDYARLTSADAESIDPYTATGQDTSIISARVSYFLGLQGPSLTLNTACSSSLVAVHLACQSLARGESELALAGGVHVMASPLSTVAMTKFGAMNPDGQCRAFDAGANGYVRGEGAGLVVLEPLSRAVAAGRRIYGVIRGSAVNNDGFSNGLTAPNPKAQVAVVRAALADAGVEAGTIDYVETHGPGTLLGDPMEAGALGAALGARRPGASSGERVLAIGSVKTNLGHLEAAAGVTGLIKTALALHHRAIPPNLYFERANPHIDFAGEGLAVPTALAAWPERESNAPPRAGVSSFGFGGTNCHAVLEAAPTSRARLLVVEADDAEQLRVAALELFGAATAPASSGPSLGLKRTPGGRDSSLRAAALVRSRAELLAELTALLSAPAARARRAPGPRPKLVFVCPGHGSQWPGMIRGLIHEPVVRQTFEACERALGQRCEWSLLEALCADASEGPAPLEVVQVTLCATAIALGRLWRAWGVEPDALVGHSVGEVAAAHLAGVLSLADAMTIVLARSRAIAGFVQDEGGMLVVDLDGASTLAGLGAAAEGLCVAVDGSPRTTVLSGARGRLAAAAAILNGLGIRHARVEIEYASHSPVIEPALGPLAEALAGISPGRASVPLRSTTRDAWLDGPECDAEHWVRNLRDPVRLGSAIRGIAKEQPCVFIELGGHPVVLEPIRQLVAEREAPSWTLASGRRGEDAREVMLASVAELYPLGVDPDWAMIGAGSAVVGSTSDRPRAAASDDGGPIIPLLISGTHEAGLRAQADRLRASLARGPEPRLVDLGYSLATTRTHFERRAVVFARAAELSAALAELGAGAPASAGRRVEGLATVEGAVAWLFPATSQLPASGVVDMLEASLEFARAIDGCERALEDHPQRPEGSLRGCLIGELEGCERLREAARIAGMIALAEVWAALGVEPDALVGSGAGLIAAAVFAGCVSLGDALSGAVSSGANIDLSGAAIPVLSSRALGLVDGELNPASQARLREAGYAFVISLELDEGSTSTEAEAEDAVEDAVGVAALARDEDGRASPLEPLATLHARGLSVAWERVFAPLGPRVVDLPTHAFIRERCWLPSAAVERGPEAATNTSGRARVIFVFPGQGGQWLGMGRTLIASEPSFRRALAACDRALAPHFEGSVLAELEADEARSRLDRNDVIQPVLWAFQIALAELWRARGVEPDAVMGHSMGEIAAACVAGALTLEDGARIVARRSQIARARAAGRGEMAVVELSIADAERAVADSGGAVVVGVHNGPRSCVLSGEPEALTAVLAKLEARAVFCRRVKVDYASHSPLIEPLVEPVRAALVGIAPRSGRIPMLSTVRADWQPGASLGPEYWATNLRARVRFAEGVDRLLAPAGEGPSASWGDAPRVFVEIGPHPVLTTAIADASGPGRPARALGSLRRGEDERACMDEVLDQLRAASAAHRPGPPRDAPAGLRELSSPALAKARVAEGRLDPRRMTHLDDHRVGGARVVAGAELALLIFAGVEVLGLTPVMELEQLTIPTAWVLGEGGAVQIVARPGAQTGRHEIELFGRGAQSWTVHARASYVAECGARSTVTGPDAARRSSIDVAALYRELGERGLEYGPAFRALATLERDAEAFEASLVVDPSLSSWARGVVCLDAAFQAVVGFDSGPSPLVPVAIGRLIMRGDPGRTARAIGRVEARGQGAGRELVAKLELVDAAGEVLVAVDALRLKPLVGLRLAVPELIGLEWETLDRGALAAQDRRRVAIVGPGGGPLVDALAAGLEAAGDEVQILGRDGDAALDWADAVVSLDGGAETGALESLVDRCEGLRLLALGLAARGPASPRLFVLTAGAERVEADDEARAEQAALGALATTLAYEQPQLRCVRVDLSAGIDASGIAALVSVLRSPPDHEDRLAVRGPRCLAARLRPLTSSPRVTPDFGGTHLITGGLGGLGLRLARRLAARGAERLILLGRRGIVDDAQAAALAAIEATGVRVDVRRCDVSDHDALAAVFAELGAALDGVFHLAATLDDGLLASLDRDRFTRVMAAKVAGACHLDSLSAGLELRHFVLFSSIVAQIGSPGQGNYAAANAFIDALALRRRRAGLPAVAIGWGPFAELGLVAQAADSLARRGLRPLLPDRGMDLLEGVLADPSLARVGVARFDPQAWLAAYPALAHNRTLSAYRAPLGQPEGLPPSEGVVLTGASASERRASLTTRVRAAAAAALRIDPERLHPRAELAELGLDSLTGLELRNRLEQATGLELPASFAWSHSRLDALVEELGRLLGASVEAEHPLDADASGEPDAEDDELSKLAQDELLRALSAELGESEAGP
ncbi:Phthiocerol/phenolphthiocerol synthesis polyketide synthase type I PpsA [Enhygromyxa salina]|uniref:Phthiocerol/phenolphthiocerol synthesis polyketide synthase type I PpsA n=1 Tax=Enhygromyxa salina TaxID=215803 RepID=A0A2S9Y089_9BACT|nr:type I polyketide synthase [Enhygromyxa salina]PRP98516.1 Phthiocerol/phenolphthiocerol synthesis polyketide synthase type I PpsA [Enhygromyxa salina]